MPLDLHKLVRPRWLLGVWIILLLLVLAVVFARESGAQTFRVTSTPDSVFVGDSVIVRVEARAAGATGALVARPALRAGAFNRQVLDLASAAYSRVKFTALAEGTSRYVVLWERQDNPMVLEGTIRVVRRPAPVVIAYGLVASDTTLATRDTAVLRLVLPDSQAGDSTHWILPDEGSPAMLEAVRAEFDRRYGGPSLAEVIRFRTGKDTIQRSMTRLDSLIRYTTMADVEEWGGAWRDMGYPVAAFLQPTPADRLDGRFAVSATSFRPGAQTLGVVHYRNGVEQKRYFITLRVAGLTPLGIPVRKGGPE